MPMILPIFAVLFTLMIGTMSGGIINISFDTIMHHSDEINAGQADAAIILFLCNMGAIAALMGHAVSEVSEIPSTAKCIGNRLPLKQTLYILSLTIITLSVMTYIATKLPTDNTNTIPLLIMCVELYFIAICPPIKQIVEFRIDTADNNTKQGAAKNETSKIQWAEYIR